MKKMNFRIFALALLWFISTDGYSQIDIHSQYYANEPMLNPALTGLTESKWRLKLFRRYEMHDDFNSLNKTNYFDMRFTFSRQAGDYGLNIREFSGWMMGVGILVNRVHHGLEDDHLRADHLSLSFHRKLNKNNYISTGIQPGYIRMHEDRSFGLNAGVMYGNGQIECWTEDQYFQTQVGLSAYNILSDFRNNDTSYNPGRRIQFHGGYLIKEPKHFNIFANAAMWYDSRFSFSAGANVLFFPIVHYKYYDRARLGLHYRSSNHIVLSGGLRLYGRGQKTLSIDATVSYDIGLGFLDVQPRYRNAVEFGIVITPLRKCWSLSKC